MGRCTRRVGVAGHCGDHEGHQPQRGLAAVMPLARVYGDWVWAKASRPKRRRRRMGRWPLRLHRWTLPVDARPAQACVEDWREIDGVVGHRATSSRVAWAASSARRRREEIVAVDVACGIRWTPGRSRRGAHEILTFRATSLFPYIRGGRLRFETLTAIPSVPRSPFKG